MLEDIDFLAWYYITKSVTENYPNSVKLWKTYKTVNGRKEGRYLELFGNGTIKQESYYIDGLLCGPYVEYYANGKIKKKCNYFENKLDGESTEYFDTGKIHKIAQFTKDKFNGLYIRHLYDGGVVKTNYKDDTVHGLEQHWNANGFLESECEFVDGILHGIYKVFYDNGTPKTIGQMFNGEKYGEFLEYDGHGEMSKVSYLQGMHHGVCSEGNSTFRYYLNQLYGLAILNGEVFYYWTDGSRIKLE